MARALLTGFEPFGGSEINSSWEIAVRVGQLSPKGVVVETMQLPVSFKCAGEAIRKTLRENQPNVLVMLGQRGKGTSIDIERIAVNLMDSVNPDNDGCQPQEQAITADGEAAYFSNLPVKVLRDALLQKSILARVSNSAGLYVCNSTYYNALEEIQKHQLSTKAVFVHLPKIGADFPLAMLMEAVKTIIETVITIGKDEQIG
ncbi:MAG: pyroglutamyl-peptidase I [Bacteroidaceae bacterium]|nr:pyroglutamyl-peptidase I [Bacteroidaceae bacterium]